MISSKQSFRTNRHRYTSLRTRRVLIVIVVAAVSIIPFTLRGHFECKSPLAPYGFNILGSLSESPFDRTDKKKDDSTRNITSTWTEYHDHPTTDQEPSLKVIAYVFPQFHPIPENDGAWGTGFTDWMNVKKVTMNQFGVETLHPTEEVGYYNLLDKSTRERYARFARESGVDGFVYHHYWFGKPVMEKPLELILADGEPNLPFMLSWANQPWIPRWNGAEQDHALMDQVYGGINDWREHFDWLLPYFKHPLYIRSNGKVQFVVYDPQHVGALGQTMYAAWRKWAVEEGLGGLDIIETVIQGDNPNSRGMSDAISEFAPRSGANHDATTWVNTERLSRVYHRGARVTWDTSPRHISDGLADSDTFIHPSLWKLSLVEIMRRMKLEPNPRGEENFLFLNAFNEWGEGNVLEPSKQWDNKFSVALREATEIAAKLPWKDDMLSQGEEIQRDIDSKILDPDVCVIIRVSEAGYPWNRPFDLSHLLRSLQAQSNKKWRAIVGRVSPEVHPTMASMAVAQAMDPRISYVDVPADIVDGFRADPDSRTAIDWMLGELNDIHPSCRTAPYMLVTDSSKTYEPGTFDLAVKDTGDIIGLNFLSPATMQLTEREMPWDDRCDRFLEDETLTCMPMEPKGTQLDLGAALINLPRWREEGHQFVKQHSNALYLVFLAKHGWDWVQPKTTDCHLIHGSTLPACVRSGRFWFDGPPGLYDGHIEPGCQSLVPIVVAFGWGVGQWDYQRFKEDPFCLRLSEEAYRFYTHRLDGSKTG